MNPQLVFFVNLAHKNIQEGHLESAERVLRQAQKIQTKNSEVIRLFGVIAAMKADYEEALIYFEQSLRISKNAITYSNKGNALQGLNLLQLALESYEKAISLDPKYAEVYNNRGNTLFLLGKFEEAIESYEKAITLDPIYADAYNGRSNSFSRQGNLLKALESCETARRLNSNAPNILSSCLSARIKICFWDALQDLISQLFSLAMRPGSKVHPFDFLAILDNPEAIGLLTRQYMLDVHPTKDDLGELTKKPQDLKIKIGYFSGDFANHPVSHLMIGTLESHNHQKFEIFAFSYRAAGENDLSMRDRIFKSCDHFIDVSSKSDREVAVLARELEIDIAIDLGGLTLQNRPGVFAYRAAPIQISYIGYLGTMGASYYDYLIADKTIIPSEEQNSYVEKIIYLPSYQSNDPSRYISDKIFTRQELGLPDEGFVYCCFNNNYKITPYIFDSWARVLIAVEGSCLMLYADNEEVKMNLLREIEVRGIDGRRLIFARKIAREEYLSRYRAADLFLDTSPYNAGATASDALWAGLPVLTFIGKSFSARMGASILNAIGLPEMVASSQEQYESLAIEFGLNPNKIQTIKKKLQENRLRTPLFDTKTFTENLELAYTKVYERYQSNFSPENIY